MNMFVLTTLPSNFLICCSFVVFGVCGRDSNSTFKLVCWCFCQDNAQKIAEFLATHPRVKKVNYAGLPGHPGRDLHYSQVWDTYVE